jgi:hypothetical protein
MDLKDLTKQKFLKALKNIRTKSGWKVLLVDDESMRNISACLGMYDIMEQGAENVSFFFIFVRFSFSSSSFFFFFF